MRRHSLVRFSPVAALALASGAFAQGQESNISYQMHHDFTWIPPAGSTVVPRVTMGEFRHIWIDEYNHTMYYAWSVDPAGQDPGFDGFGREIGSGHATFNVPRLGGPPVLCNLDHILVDPTAGLHQYNRCISLISPNTNTWANACYEVDVWSYGAGAPIQGRLLVAGGANAFGWGTKAYSYSTLAVTIDNATSAGTVQWVPDFDSVSGSAFAEVIRHDPITVTAIDAGGVSHSQDVLTVDYSSSGGDHVSWTGGVFSTDSRDATFHAIIGGSAATNPGEFYFRIQNGAVTSSYSNGSLGFPPPPPGATTPFSMPMPNGLSVSYNAGNMFPGVVRRTRLDMFGGADAPASVVDRCGSADFDCDGDLGTDADIEAFFACLAGVCPEGCGSTADFNGDGDLGTDADIEAFFRVLGGARC